MCVCRYVVFADVLWHLKQLPPGLNPGACHDSLLPSGVEPESMHYLAAIMPSTNHYTTLYKYGR